MTLRLLTGGLAALLSFSASAQPAAAPEQLDAVSVTLQRDANVLPYARINELLTLLQRHGQGLVRADFRLSSVNARKEPIEPLIPPQLAIQHADRYIPIKLDADRVFELPILPPEMAKEADLATNQPKGSLRIALHLNLTTPPEALDMATVRRIVAMAHTLRAELLPWYLRLLAPQIEGVRICSAQPAWSLQWVEQGQLVGVPLPADAQDREPDTPPGQPGRPCTTLTGQEGWPDAARLVAPTNTKLSPRLR